VDQPALAIGPFRRGFYILRNRATGKLIDVSGGSLSDGANVIQWTDNGGSNQKWQVVVAN
jgi:hypothetical protein